MRLGLARKVPTDLVWARRLVPKLVAEGGEMAQVAFNNGVVKTTVMMTTSAAELSLFESTQPKR